MSGRSGIGNVGGVCVRSRCYDDGDGCRKWSWRQTGRLELTQLFFCSFCITVAFLQQLKFHLALSLGCQCPHLLACWCLLSVAAAAALGTVCGLRQLSIRLHLAVIAIYGYVMTAPTGRWWELISTTARCRHVFALLLLLQQTGGRGAGGAIVSGLGLLGASVAQTCVHALFYQLESMQVIEYVGKHIAWVFWCDVMFLLG